MKAVYLTGIRQVKVEEKPLPEIKEETDVLIRVKTVTICGSDVHYYSIGHIGDQYVSYPSIIGHECSGYVEATGKKVQGLKAGDLVAVDPAVSCNACDQCLAGRPHTCLSLKFMGCPGELEGALQEYIVLPEQSCFKVKKGISPVDAALAEPLSIGVYSVKQAQLKPLDKIGIMGYGPIGISVMQTAKAKGHKNFYIIDKINERLALAKKLKAKLALNFLYKSTFKQILTIEKHGLDVVFECCGQQEALDEAILMLKPGGKLVIIGIPEFDTISFNINLIRRKEISIINIRRQNNCMAEAIELIENKKVMLDYMPTHFFDFKEAGLAFNWVENYRDGVIKAVINF